MTKNEKNTLVQEVENAIILFCKEDSEYNRINAITTIHLAHALGMTDEELNKTIDIVRNLDSFLVGNKNNIECVYVRNGSIHF